MHTKQAVKISCPSCGHQFNVEEVLSHQLEESLKLKFEQEKKSIWAQVFQKEEVLKEKESQFEEKRKRENEIFQAKLEEAKIRETERIKIQFEENFLVQMESLRKENEEKNTMIKSLQGKELELITRERQMNEAKERMELDIQRQLLERTGEIETKARQKEKEQFEMQLRERDKVLEDQKKLIEEMKRKSEQGSMQLQGEVQELALEAMLAELFPFDIIEEVKKGARGADVIQLVRNEFQQVCGKIIYESKRTKDFNANWLAKLKEDQQAENADIAVLITQVMPKGMDRAGLMDGVWVSSYFEFKGMVMALRHGIIEVSRKMAIQSNKGDKMSMIYDYLTSNEFRMCMENIVEVFIQLKEGIDKERRSYEKLWNEREKTLERGIMNAAQFYGSLKGITGKALPDIQELNLLPG